MSRLGVICLCATFFLAATGCNLPLSEPNGWVAEAYLPDAASVAFDLEPVQLVNGSLQLKATYASQGKTADFSIELGPAKASGSGGTRDSPINTGEGRFVAEAESDASILLADLQKALEARAIVVPGFQTRQ